MFIMISRSGWAEIGKPLVLGSTFAAINLLLWWLLKGGRTISSALLAALTLSVSYYVAFHLVGALSFPGLLKDFDLRSWDYLLSIGRVFLNVLAVYVTWSGAVLGASRLGGRRSHNPL